MIRLIQEFYESIRIALEQLRAHKMRAFLTALGVIIGIMAVTLMGTAIETINKGFQKSLDMIGQDILYVEKMPWRELGEDRWRFRNRPDIDLDGAAQLTQIFAETPDSSLLIAVPVTSTFRNVNYGERSVTGVNVIGTTADFVITSAANFEKGRFFTENEVQSANDVVVLGYDIAEALFPSGDPIGERVRIQNRNYRVIGVVARQGSFLGMMSWDHNVIMPLPSLRKFWGGNWGNSIRVKVREGVDIEEAIYELEGAVRRVRGLLPGRDNDFEINRSEMLEEQMGPAKKGIAIAGLGITGLALFVGAIGIMNITFVSVRERTREIGTRRAIGARRSSILTQFLVESTSICILGGIVGVGLTWMVQQGVQIAFPDFPISFSLTLVLLAFGASVLTGVISGFLPAWAASRLDPATALRHE